MSRPGARDRPGLFLGAAALLVLSALPASAQEGDVEVPFAVRHGQRVAYQLELEAYFPGTIRITANWPGNRRLTLRLEPAGGNVADARGIRRTGPSPQTLEIPVQPGSIDAPSRWTLSLRALAAGGGGDGLLSIEMPQRPPPEPVIELVPVTPEQAVQQLPAWPANLPDTWHPWQREAQQFEQSLVRHPRPDTCRWQTAFADQQRAWSGKSGLPLDQETRLLLGRLVDVVRRVEVVRTTDDPIVAGPPPADPLRREAWSRVREKRLRALVEELDRLLTSLERLEGGTLVDETWPARLMTCLTACERHFVERGRVGREQAINLELAEQQWDRILAAARVLERFLPLTDAPAG